MTDTDATNTALIFGEGLGHPAPKSGRVRRRPHAVLAASATLMLVSGACGARAAESQPDGPPPPQASASQPEGSPAQTPASKSQSAPLPAQAPSPIGVFGVNMPDKGHFIFSVLPSFSLNSGSMIGTSSVSPQYIITHVKSPYTPDGDHLLRMAPQSLSVETQTFNVAYGLTPNVTLNIASSLVEKSLNMQTFKGLTGTTSLGYSRSDTWGLGDTQVSTIVRVYRDRINQVTVNFGLSLPTGSTTETQSFLLPTGLRPTSRAFYVLQTGTGTVDAMPGISYSGVLNRWSWGASYRGRLPLDDNSEGYRYGDYNEINFWGGYSWTPGLETTLRLNGTEQGTIHGEDAMIRGFGQTADPMFYGGQQISLFAGAIVSGSYIGIKRAQLGFEVGAPLYQNLNGPQLGRDWQVNLALRFKL